jgi:DNA-binding GntR family transcriptional regulator
MCPAGVVPWVLPVLGQLRGDALLTDEAEGSTRLEGSLSKTVYEWLRERIIDGTLRPGERIRERELAEQLKVSRIPVREALPQLESEGYIKTLPRRGAVVTQMTLRDAEELFDVRSSLEVLAAKLAARECAAGASTERLVAVLAEAENAVAGREAQRIAEINSTLHDVILELSNNHLLQRTMFPISGRVRRLFHIVTDRDQAELHREHIALCEAIVSGNSRLAEALAFAHVEKSRQESMPIVAALLSESGAAAPS